MSELEKKPVIWTIAFWYSPNFTGAGIQAHHEHREFVRHGIFVTVLTAGVSTARLHRGQTVNLDGVIVKYLSVIPFPLSTNISRFRLLDKFLFSISANLSSLSFGVWCAWILLLHGQPHQIVRLEGYDRYALIPLAIVRLKGLHPIIRMSLLGSDDPYSILERARGGQILEYLTLYSFSVAESIVAICSAMIESCQKAKIAREKVTYLSYGIDTVRFQPASEECRNKISQELGLDRNKRYILFVGSAIARKGIDVLVDAFIQLHAKMEDVELLIVGPDRFDQGAHFDAATLQKLVHDCKEKLLAAKCDQFVHWIGEVDNVHEYMQAADVFCLPTRQEGFGLVIIEAMASGLPVVVSRLEGVTTDIISSAQVGLSIPGFQFEDYAEAILEVLNNPQKAKLMGETARTHVISKFSLEHSAYQWKNLFRKLIQGKTSMDLLSSK
jgi:glycosyltransferase involved in cell wall biosynthesis